MFNQLCNAANIPDLSVLPGITKYIKNGRNTLCYSNCMGYCPHNDRGCHFKHASKEDQNDDFCKDLCDKLEAGMNWMVRNGVPVPGGVGCGRGGARGTKRTAG